MPFPFPIEKEKLYQKKSALSSLWRVTITGLLYFFVWLRFVIFVVIASFEILPIMGSANAKAVEVKVPELPAPANTEKPKLKPCCACPETKKVRDAW